MHPNCGTVHCSHSALPALPPLLSAQGTWQGEGNPPVMFTASPRPSKMCSVQKQPTVSPAGPLVPLVTIDDVSEMMLGWTNSAWEVGGFCTNLKSRGSVLLVGLGKKKKNTSKRPGASSIDFKVHGSRMDTHQSCGCLGSRGRRGCSQERAAGTGSPARRLRKPSLHSSLPPWPRISHCCVWIPRWPPCGVQSQQNNPKEWSCLGTESQSQPGEWLLFFYPAK